MSRLPSLFGSVAALPDDASSIDSMSRDGMIMVSRT